MQVQTRHSGLAAADPACCRQGMELGSSLSRAAELPLQRPCHGYPASVASREAQSCWLTAVPRTHGHCWVSPAQLGAAHLFYCPQ